MPLMPSPGLYDREQSSPLSSANDSLTINTYDLEGAAPLSTVKKEPPFGSTEYYQNEFLKRKADREKRFQDVIDVIKQTRDKLMSKPTELTKDQYLQGLLQSMRQARETQLPGGGYARQTPFNMLQTFAGYTSGAREAEKKSKEEKEADLLKLDELTKKYMYGEAKGAEDQAMQELRLFGTTKAKKVAPELQKVLDALDIVNSDAPAEAKAAAQRIIEDSKTKRGDSSSLGQFYRALDESRNPDPKIAERGRQGLAFLRRGGKKGGLTLSNIVHDTEIDKARAALRNIPQDEIDLAMRVGMFGDAKQQDIARNYKLAQKTKYSEVQFGGQAAPIDEDMTGENDEEE